VSTIAESLTMAFKYHRAGDIHRAETIYRQILQLDPRHAEALHHMGLIAHQVGKLDIAVNYLERSLALMRHNPRCHSNLGMVYQAQGKLDQALACYQKALRLKPDYHEAHNNLANTLVEQGKLDEAVASYRRALALNANNAQPHYNLGSVLARQGKLDEAAASFQKALRLKPDYGKAHMNLGLVFLDQDKLDQAQAELQEAVRVEPRNAAAYNNLGNVLKKQSKLFADQKKLEEAAAFYRQALCLEPDLAEAHGGLGSVLGEQGKAEEAVGALQKALELRPSEWLRIAVATHLPIIYQSMAELESWRSRLVREIRLLREQQVVHDATDKPALTLFYLAYQGCNDRDIQRDVARLYKVESSMFDVQSSESQPRTSNTEHRAIRVGFLSSFFRRHTIGMLMGGLVKQLSRKDFEVIVLSVGRHEDEVAAFFKQHADRFVELPTHLPTARRIIEEQHLDVLIYTDIGMEPVTSTLAHSRLAPVQCTTWGHPVTSGMDTIDYFISSEALETEEAEQHYTETLVRLKNLPIFYYRPELPRPLLRKEDFGLTSESHVYACPQSLFKLHPEFDPVLGGILRGDPRGTVLLSWGSTPQWEQLLRQRFAATLPDVVDRIRFLPKLKRPEFLNLMAVSDVLLDPLHFGGGNTSYEGLAVGVPIVTLPSRLLRGRITFALYQQMGMLDCVVHSPGEYIELALRLGTDKAYRETVRAKIVDGNSVLYENSTGVKELEEFVKGIRPGQNAKVAVP
jgi:protein O-GlcNAc transferase